VAYMLERGGHIDAIGRENIFDSKRIALATIYGRLNRSICDSCTLRIFRECGTEVPVPPPEPAARAKPEPVVVRPTTVSTSATVSRKKKKKRTQVPDRPPRVLAFVEFDLEAEETAREAWHIAQESDAELALGNIVQWNWGSGHDLAAGLIATEAAETLRVPARQRLGEIAAEAGIEDAALLASAGLNRNHAALELISSWQPDLLVVHTGSRLGFSENHPVEFQTPLGTASCQVRMVG
jgi:hypothetical protein